VETHAQAARLSALGCDSAQGWHFARPCRPADLGPAFGRLARCLPHGTPPVAVAPIGGVPADLPESL
jgi:predicted signal transduction protein with EAL and GGDEF domain